MNDRYELPSNSIPRLSECDERAAETAVWIGVIALLIFAAGIPFLIAAFALRFGAFFG